jgi:glycosyltransferase involved in cell wall biosynthesis
MFPQLSETFVANEIVQLERLGIRIRVYSYRKPMAAVPHECVRRIQAPIEYLPDPLYRHPLTLLRAHQAVFRRDPARYRRTARYVLGYTMAERNPDTWRRFLHAGYLAQSAREANVQRLHAHFAHGATRVAMLTSMLTGLRFSFTAHARDIYTANSELLGEKIAAAEYVVTCTRANQDYLRQLVEPTQRRKILLGYHGVDVEKFTPAPDGRGTDAPVILSVGRLVEKKGFPDLLRACDILRRKGYAFRCLLVGDGPERPALEAMVRSLQLEDIVGMPGSYSQEELLPLYRRATVFALPCRILKNGDRDGIPNVLLEAMAVGLPVVSSAVSGIGELVRDGENGLLVHERDDKALAAAIESLVRDGSLRERLSENARTTVAARFDAAATSEALARLFRNGTRPTEAS